MSPKRPLIAFGNKLTTIRAAITYFITRILQLLQVVANLKSDAAFCFWVNILKVTLSHFIDAACIQLEYPLTVRPQPATINQGLRYDIHHKLVTGFAGVEESDGSLQQSLLALSACEKRLVCLR